MTKAREQTQDHADESWRALTDALNELEIQVIARARDLLSLETESMKDRIAEIERIIKTPAEVSAVADAVVAQDELTIRPVLGGPLPLPEENPASRVSRQAGPVALPPLPPRLSIASLQHYLAGLGFHVVNNRQNGGGVWLFYGQDEFGKVADHLMSHGIGVQRYPNGRRRRVGDQYEIDPYKVLPDR